MYECKLPFNPKKKFNRKEFVDIDVRYRSKWDLVGQDDDIITLINLDNLLVSLPLDKFDIHFREL